MEDEADVEALVRDVVTGVEREALRRGISLVVGNDPSSRAKIVRAAPSLYQVMTNLLLNAIAMSPEGSTVHVETAANGGGDARLSVIDSGPGIDPARWTTIFGGGYTTRSGGAGVGLRHAHALASSHGGKLSLGESARGARFDVKWPVVALRPPMSRISSMPGLSLDGVHILLLEDDDAVIGLLSTALSLRGATVHAARNSTELEAATKSRTFDAALLDLSPIANDVGGALTKVQQRCPKAKLVLISGTAAEVPFAAQGLMTAWIRKPFEVGEILAVLRGFTTVAG
jgi:CheY-like chemotaxis protein